MDVRGCTEGIHPIHPMLVLLPIRVLSIYMPGLLLYMCTLFYHVQRLQTRRPGLATNK